MSGRDVVVWAFPLNGDATDLETLVAALEGFEIHVARRGDSFVLLVPARCGNGSARDVREIAEHHVEVLNGVGRLLDTAFRPVRLSRQSFGLDAEGTDAHTVVAVEGVEVQVRMGTPRVLIDGVLQPDPRQVHAARLLKAAQREVKAQDALTILGRGTLTWPELYILFELVQSDVGEGMVANGWISRKDLELFKRTANSYDLLGIDSRHGRQRGEPPSVPMALDTARASIGKLTSLWLGSFAE